MKRFSIGLRARLLWLVLCAIVPAFGLIGYTALTQRERDVADAVNDATNLVQLVAREQEQLITSTHQLLITLAQLPDVRQPGSAVACSRLLSQLNRSFPFYTNIGVATLDGNLFCNSRPLSRPINIGDRSYFRRAVESQDFAIGDYQVGRVSGSRSLNFGYPVRDDAKKTRAVIYAALDLAWLEKLLATVKLPAGSALTVIDGHGTILARYPESEKWSGKAVPDSTLVKTILAHHATGTANVEGLDGRRRFYAFTKLQESFLGNVYVSVGIPQDVAFSASNEDFRRNVELLLIVAALALIAAWTGGNVFILRRINALDTTAQRLAKGELSARTGLPYGNEELGRLARNFDHMAAVLQHVNRALKTLSAGNRVLVRATSERVLLADMCRIIVEVGGYRFAWIGYAEDDEHKTVRPVMQHGFKNGLEALSAELGNVTWEEGERGRGPVGTAIRNAKPYIARNILTDPNFSPWRQLAVRHGYASSIALPLRVGDKTIGALGIYSEEPDAFDAEELELLSESADDLAFGIATLRTRSAHDRAHATIEHMARYDRLTGLPNHAYFEERLRQIVNNNEVGIGSLALLVIDLDRLREINDALGFSQGDTVLKDAGARIRRALSDEAFVARMRGDEFGVLLQVSNPNQAADTAQRILNILKMPFAIGDLNLEVSAVVGISLFPQHGEEATHLLRHADVAMQQAKKAGKGYLFYETGFDEGGTRRLALAGELRHAIENSDLVLHYQPKIDMRNGRVCGAEALVRWVHSMRGMIRPDEFIGLAERTGLIESLTEWVLQAALRQSSAWRQDGIALPIAINLSTRNLRDPALVGKIERSLAAQKVEATMLELEITEGAVMDDPEGALVALTRLSDMGIALYIDDFGTGYSSLSYLKKLPVDAVKIDKSFVADMLTELDSAAIVRSTISLAHELDLQVVAEGIERQAVWVQLASLGCDVAQGYHISKPLPATQFKDWFSARSRN